jgi:hypothetical protein
MRKSASLCLLAGLALMLSGSQSAMAQPRPQDFPLRCHGKQGMASTSGANLIINFAPSDGPAGRGLDPGECSWLDRALRSSEPRRVVDTRPSPGEARNIATLINRGETWTFWVFNSGNFLKATTSARGTPREKPSSL